MTSCRTETETVSNAESWSLRLLLQSSVSSVAVLYHGSTWTLWANFVMDSWFNVFG